MTTEAPDPRLDRAIEMEHTESERALLDLPPEPPEKRK